MKKRIIDKFLLKNEGQYDLNDWREWFSNSIALIFAVLFPLTFIYLFPDYIARGLYYLIFIDIILWIYLLLRAVIPVNAFFLPNYSWLILFYFLTISFFLNLGPGYARPGWIIFCSVIAAVFYGVSGALISSFLNFAIIIILFYVSDTSVPDWLRVHEQGLKNWIIFAANITLLSSGASVSVGFLINRLNSSLKAERNIKEELQASNEELTAAIEELEAVNEAFEAQNNELILSTDALKGSEQELKDVFNSSYDAFIVHGIDGKIYDVNKRMLEMFGLNRDEALSLIISDILSPGIDLTQIAKSWQWITDDKAIIFEWRSRRPSDDSYFDSEITLRRFNRRGKEAILSSIRDLTERKKAEAENQLIQAQLVQAQKMDAIGTLAGGIAHDFNNALGGIIGSLSILNTLLKDEDLKEYNEILDYMQIALDSSNRAADITKQLLVLSRKANLQMTPVQAVNSIYNVMKICKSSFPKIVELDFKPVDPSLKFSADPTQIEQVLLNLCLNASHAMTMMRKENEPPGGKLTVEADKIICDSAFCAVHNEAVPGSVYIRIRVTDNGVGIDDDCRKRIFEPFFTTKSQDEGTGLGLAITYTIIMQHKGFIDVSSERGMGSVFTVYLPQLDENSIDDLLRTPEIIKGSGRILVIDDEQNMLLIARGILKQCGYTVAAAGSASKGIELFSNSGEKFDAVMIDNSMPEMSGLNVYLAMREIYPGVRVMLCSGFMDEDTIAACRENGILEFINKPYSTEELSIKMHNLLNK